MAFKNKPSVQFINKHSKFAGNLQEAASFYFIIYYYMVILINYPQN